MYLTEIDADGLIKMDETGSGWLAISVFNRVYKKYGRRGMTVIALSTDYLTVFRHYENKDDRFIVSVDEKYEKRSEFKRTKLVEEALLKYDELQYNSDLEQERINSDIKNRLLGKLKKANDEDDDAGIAKHNKALQLHEASIASFNKRFDREKALQMAVSSSGYELSRIEIDIMSSKKSKFVHHGKDLENHDNLKLED